MDRKKNPPADSQEIANKYPGLTRRKIPRNIQYFPNVSEKDLMEYSKKRLNPEDEIEVQNQSTQKSLG